MTADSSLVSFEGYGLTTAEILYRMPDHRELLQSFIWQNYDTAPHFPVLNRFLAFWREKIEGPLHSISISHHKLLTPAECRIAAAQFSLN